MIHAYQIGDVAALTGVSIRTLRHYDQIGLLRPSGRTESGYRLYTEDELVRLQQILTLRYLGFSLHDIGGLLAHSEVDQVEMLRAQRNELRARIAGLRRVEQAVGRLLERRMVTGQWEWALIVAASVNTQEELQRGERTMTPDERRRQFEELANEVTPEEVAAVERGWAELLAEIRANFGLEPSSPQAQALGDRWAALIQATFRGHTELMQGVAEGYQIGEYADVAGAPTTDDFAYIGRVFTARKAKDQA